MASVPDQHIRGEDIKTVDQTAEFQRTHLLRPE